MTQKIRKNGQKHGGGWNPHSPRKSFNEKMTPLVVMVKRSEYAKALVHLRKEALAFRGGIGYKGY